MRHVTKSLSKLPVRLQLSLILVAFSIPLFLISYELNRSFQNSIQVARLEISGSTYIMPLIELLNDVADYKLSARMSQAGIKLGENLSDMSATVDQRIEEIKKNDAVFAQELGMSAESLKIDNSKAITITELEQKWQSLKSDIQSVEKTNEFLSEVNEIIRHVADVSGLVLDPDADSYYLMDATINQLSKTLEIFADLKSSMFDSLLRGQNSLLAADIPHISTLNYLVMAQQLESVKLSVQKAIDTNGLSRTVNVQLKEKMPQMLAEYVSAAENFDNITRDLLTGKKSMSPESYIAVADIWHDDSAKLATGGVNVLIGLLQDRISEIQADQRRVWLIGLSGLMVALGLYCLSSAGIVGSIKNAQTAMDRIASGDTNFTLFADNSKNELNKMIHSLLKLREVVDEAFGLKQIIEEMPVNIMVADPKNEFKISYANKETIKNLSDLEGLLPIKASELIGTSIDVFHKDPGRIRKLLQDEKNLPHVAKIKVGPNTLRLRVSAIMSKAGEYIAPMVAWENITVQEDLASNFDSGVAGFIRDLSLAVNEMDTTSTTLSKLATLGMQKAQDLEASATHASENVHSVAGASEEMSASIREINQQINTATRVSKEAVETVRAAEMTIQELKEGSQKINEVIELIQDIADQTNLLALNATIEAARAGEAGKGFAVVANEVKTLASQTGKATDEVGAQVAAIQIATDNAINAIVSISKTIEQINEIAASISTAMEEQTAVMLHVVKSTHSAAERTQQVGGIVIHVSKAANDTEAAASGLGTSATDLSKRAEDLRGAVEVFLANLKAQA